MKFEKTLTKIAYGCIAVGCIGVAVSLIRGKILC